MFHLPLTNLSFNMIEGDKTLLQRLYSKAVKVQGAYYKLCSQFDGNTLFLNIIYILSAPSYLEYN